MMWKALISLCLIILMFSPITVNAEDIDYDFSDFTWHSRWVEGNITDAYFSVVDNELFINVEFDDVSLGGFRDYYVGLRILLISHEDETTFVDTGAGPRENPWRESFLDIFRPILAIGEWENSVDWDNERESWANRGAWINHSPFSFFKSGRYEVFFAVDNPSDELVVYPTSLIVDITLDENPVKVEEISTRYTIDSNGFMDYHKLFRGDFDEESTYFVSGLMTRNYSSSTGGTWQILRSDGEFIEYTSPLIPDSYMSDFRAHALSNAASIVRKYNVWADRETASFTITAPHENFLDVPAPVAVLVDDVLVNFDQQPINVDDRLLVPVRAIAEAMNFEAEWDDVSQSATLGDGDTTVRLTIGQPSIEITGSLGQRTVPLDVPPQIINGRTMLPLRAIAEAFDAVVSWDSHIKVARIEASSFTRCLGNYAQRQ